MRIRNLTADSMPEAMDLVRAQLGADAVILSTHSDAPDGRVRVTAAIEDDSPEDSALETIGAQTAAIDSLAGALAFHRLPDGLSNRLLTAAGRLDLKDPALGLGGALDTILNFGKLTELSSDQPVMLVGPPGAGKTSTAAKLCTLARLAAHETRLITLDGVKAGGLAQISAYGDALGAEVSVVGDPAELRDRVQERHSGRVTLIDTIGANPFDPQELSLMGRAAAESRAKVVLVLPAGGDAVESAEIALAFAEIGARAVIATKLDISRRLGGLLSALHASRLSLLAIAQSPHIVEGLKPINPISLARLIFTAHQSPQPSGTQTGEIP